MLTASAVYQNPVYDRSFPDPFVLNFAGTYYAFSTGRSVDARVFSMLRSQDLVSWTELSGAMKPLKPDHLHYWAPEVTYSDGKFYLYYSVGNEALMQIRVAVSDRPEGGYIDAGRGLTNEEFAIDPHVVRDDDGTWYLFYATDFLEHTHIGTGIVVDRMLDPFSLSGKPRPVTRAKFDWQVYEPTRKEKGGVRWHTVEGPFVLKRKGLYYEMFSGGNWQNLSYGVSYAVSNEILADGEWEQFADGLETLPVLRTIPGAVLGPGHNCVVEGPNRRDLYCVYHTWSNGERCLAIDRMDFAGGGRLFVAGPTNSPQVGPNQPHMASLEPGRLRPPGASFLYEITIRNGVRINLFGDDGSVLLVISIAGKGLTVSGPNGGTPLLLLEPAGFIVDAPHALRLDVDERRVGFLLDGRSVVMSTPLSHPSTEVEIVDEDQVEILSFALTVGLEDSFQDSFDEESAGVRGWKWIAESDPIFVEDGILNLTNGSISRHAFAADFEFCVNFRLAEALGDTPVLALKCGGEFSLFFSKGQLTLASEAVNLPSDFDPSTFHQIRFVSNGRRTDISLNGMLLGQVSRSNCDGIEIGSRDAAIELDMVRFTVLD